MPTRHPYYRPRNFSDYGLRARVARLRASYRAATKRYRDAQAVARYNAAAHHRLQTAQRRRDAVMKEYEEYSDELARREHFVNTNAKARRAALMLAYKYLNER